MRIIPAFAGNTCCKDMHTHCSGDHPRIRGEHDGRENVTVWRSGSSPHSRGTPSDLSIDSFSDGIIPAFAGNTQHVIRRPPVEWDHPRIRGEHLPA